MHGKGYTAPKHAAFGAFTNFMLFHRVKRLRLELKMTQYLILCRSMTVAQKAVRILENYGYACYLVKAPQILSVNGCGYAVSIRRKPYEALDILQKYDISYGKVYKRDNDIYTEV